MTREKAIEALEDLQGAYDIELEHCDADQVLCDLLSALGYQDVVDAWEKVEKWYA